MTELPFCRVKNLTAAKQSLSKVRVCVCVFESRMELPFSKMETFTAAKELTEEKGAY